MGISNNDQPPYDQLIEVLEAFIDGFEGGMRIRGLKTALMIQQASVEGRGITVSELARATNAPLENVRRHIAKHVERGALRYLPDPDDDRAVRVVATDLKLLEDTARAIAERLGRINGINA